MKANKNEVSNEELDFMNEGASMSIPEEVEKSCNETLDKIERSVQRASAYLEIESGLDQVPEREDLSSDENDKKSAAKN